MSHLYVEVHIEHDFSPLDGSIRSDFPSDTKFDFLPLIYARSREKDKDERERGGDL